MLRKTRTSRRSENFYSLCKESVRHQPLVNTDTSLLSTQLDPQTHHLWRDLWIVTRARRFCCLSPRWRCDRSPSMTSATPDATLAESPSVDPASVGLCLKTHPREIKRGKKHPSVAEIDRKYKAVCTAPSHLASRKGNRPQTDVQTAVMWKR